MSAATFDMLAALGASTIPEINQHIIDDAGSERLPTNKERLRAYMLAQPTMCLSEALLAAYVLNGGLVMCTGGMDNAFHIESDSEEFMVPEALASKAIQISTPAPAALTSEALTRVPEVLTPVPEVLTPVPEAPTPDLEAAIPAPEVLTPDPEAPIPAPDVLTPVPEAPKPDPEAPMPAPDVLTPVPEVLTPAPEAPNPAPEASTSDPETLSTYNAVQSTETASEDTLTASRLVTTEQISLQIENEMSSFEDELNAMVTDHS